MAVEEKPGKDRHKSHKGFKEKLSFYLGFNTANGEIRSFPQGKKLAFRKWLDNWDFVQICTLEP